MSTLNTAYLNGCLDRWQGGDLGGREALVRVAAARLEPLAHKMLKGFPNVRCWEETADVLQNTMIRLLRSLEAIRPASTRDFFNLAAVHIRRELLDLARHHRKSHGQIGGGDAESSSDPLAQVPEEAESAPELDRWCAFHQKVESLPVKQREVVGLVFYHGWTQVQVAELLDVTERTVRRWWEEALATLHAALDGSTTDSN